MNRRSRKPVRKCHACPLNLGDRCWGYASPRTQWAHGRTCPARYDETLHRLCALWTQQSSIRSLKEIRREFIHQHPSPPIFYLERSNAARLRSLRRLLGMDAPAVTPDSRAKKMPLEDVYE